MTILDTIKKTLKSEDSPVGGEPKATAEKSSTKKESRKESAGSPVKTSFGLLRGPHITEKSAFLQADRKYVFKVDSGTNKPEIKKAIEGIYKVKVSDVNILQKRDKKVRLGKHEGISSGNKKAIVTLNEGYKIEIGA